MVSGRVATAIREQHAAGWSQDDIASEHSIGRKTVCAIIANKHAPDETHGVRRCKGCGARVQLPCIACAAIEARKLTRDEQSPK
jgi:hypothetical protein